MVTPTQNILIDSCESRLTIYLSCSNLRNMDFIGRSDPFALLFLDDTGASTRPPPPNQANPLSTSLPSSSNLSPTPSSPTRTHSKPPIPDGEAPPASKLSSLSASIFRAAPSSAAAANATATASSSAGSYKGRDGRWQRIGITETVPNNLNPTFATSFEIPYFFERAQRLAIDVFDRDSQRGHGDHLHLHDYLGSAVVSVPAVVRAKRQRMTVPLGVPDMPSLRCGLLTVAVEEVSESKQRVAYNIALRDMQVRRGAGPFVTIRRRSAAVLAHEKAEGKGKGKGEMNGNHMHSDDVQNENENHSDMSLRARGYALNAAETGAVVANGKGKKGRRGGQGKVREDEDWITVYQSKAATADSMNANRGHYVITDFSHNYEKLCRSDDNLPLRFEVSFERMGKHFVVAKGTSTLQDAAARNGEIEMMADQKQTCFPVRRLPSLHLTNRRMTEDTTFLDYIIGGCEISLVIAIDFTASNGDPAKRGTLHFCDSMEPNEYESAIRAVGDILAAYDSDQMFPVYGFGAKLPPAYDMPSHLFSLTEEAIVDGAVDSSDHFCYSIDGVLNAYRHALYNVRLSGPTVFSSIVQAAADHARKEARNNEQSYTILLILTDGVINDVDKTLETLFQASSLPMSVVIIGVGDADFSDMDMLDGDHLRRERDIVQFVNYRQYMHAEEILRSRVLEEIPFQFMQYMRQRNIQPMALPDD